MLPTTYKFLNKYLINNDNYKPVIDKITYLQRMFKRKLLEKRIIALSKNRQFIELYYHPECVGGYKAKRSIEKLFK
jgi:hypothetical protein